MTTSAATPVDTLQSVLAGEHAAVYAFGVVGGRLRGTSDEATAREAYDTHLSRRNQVAAAIRASGASPVGPETAYDLGGPVLTSKAARALAARVELALCGPYTDLVGAGDEADRSKAAAWCTDAAKAGIGWGGGPIAFPGLAERA